MSIKLNKSLKRPSIFQAHSTSLIQPSRSSFIPDVTCQSQCSSRFKHAATTIVTSTVKRFKLRRGKKGVSSLEVIVPATVVAADLPLSYLSRRRRGRRPSTAVDIPLSHTLSISGPRRSQRIHPLRATPGQSELPTLQGGLLYHLAMLHGRNESLPMRETTSTLQSWTPHKFLPMT